MKGGETTSFKLPVGNGNEIFAIGQKAYHNSIPTSMFDYCLMKSIMIDIGTTSKELEIFEGQFYGTMEINCTRD